MATDTDIDIDKPTAPSAADPADKRTGADFDFPKAGLSDEKLTVDFGGEKKELDKNDDIERGGIRIKQGEPQTPGRVVDRQTVKAGEEGEMEAGGFKIKYKVKQTPATPSVATPDKPAVAPAPAPTPSASSTSTESREQPDAVVQPDIPKPEEQLTPGAIPFQEQEAPKPPAQKTVAQKRIVAPKPKPNLEDKEEAFNPYPNYQPPKQMQRRPRPAPASQTTPAETVAPVNSAASVARQAAGRVATDAAKTAVKTATKAAARSVGSAIISTAPVWGPILLGIIGVIFLIIVVMIGSCRVPGVRNLSGLNDFCKMINAEEVNVGAGTGTGIDTPTDTGQPGGTYTHAQAAAALADVGITIRSSGNCSDRTNSRCTSLEGMRIATVNEIISFKNGCDNWMRGNGGGTCTVIVTGGTEVGHAAGQRSHGTGYKFDIALNTNVNNYIRTVFRSGTARGSHPMYLNPGSTAAYYLEPNHWDVSVGTASDSESEGDRSGN